MKRLVLAAIAASLAVSPIGAQQADQQPVRVQLDAVPTSALITMLMRDVMRVPYVIAPDVLADRRPISVNLVIPRDRVPERVVSYLRKTGFAVELVGGTVYVSRRGGRSAYGGSGGGFASDDGPVRGPGETTIGEISRPSGSPLERSPVAEAPGQAAPAYSPVPVEPSEVVAYVPANRSPEYLASVVGPMFPELRLGAREAATPDREAVAVQGREAPDLFVMAGPHLVLERAKRLVVTLDRPRPMVSVKAVIMQVQDTNRRGSALSVFASIAGGKIGGGSFADAAAGGQFLRISTGALRAMLSAVHEDSRFKVVATPNLAALSGGIAAINAGAQVPTIGAVAVTDGGTPVQSVVYRDSGVILSVRPTVRGDRVQLDVRQERSSFVPTTTGVEDSPTLQRSTVDAQVVVRSGESVVLAGLTESTDGQRREGLLGGLLGVRSKDKSSSELLVVLTAEIVAQPDVPGGEFIDLEGKETTDELAPA